MPATATADLTPDTRAAARQLEALQQRAARGELIPLEQIQPLTRAPHPRVRGLARRLLAHNLRAQAEHSVAQLLLEACCDLEFGEPRIIGEAIDALDRVGRFDELVGLFLQVAESALGRGQALRALTHLANAAFADFQHGSRAINEPESIRRFVGTYQRCAELLGASAGVEPATRHQRRSTGERLRLAHVVCQLVDGGHAPSREMMSFLRYADRARFDVLLVITEAIARHPEPGEQRYVSQPSAKRAPRRLREIEQALGIPVLMPPQVRNYAADAALLHRLLAGRRVDVAFFHGSIATPTDWLLCAWQAAPWQVDLGFGVPLHCPRVDYQFFEVEATMERLAFLCRERGIGYGYAGAGHDAGEIEAAEPLPRGQLGVPGDHVLLGTIGNHLPKRMSERFCRTVAGVLSRFERATYFVIGPGDFGPQRQWFGPLVAQQRVRFVGPTREPARWTKTLDVYLNEYPAGGGFAVADAMAAGVPVVCMKVDDSSLATAGYAWVGAENAVEPPSDAAYADRLASLLRDADQRRALGQRLRRRFEERFEIRRWVQSLYDRVYDVVRGRE